jgi:acyl carrier protein
MTDNGAGLTAPQIETRILEFLERHLLGPDVTIQRDDDLLSGELLDSIGAIRLAAFLEKEFGIDMQSTGFVVENFQSVAVLAAYVLRAANPADRGSEESQA